MELAARGVGANTSTRRWGRPDNPEMIQAGGQRRRGPVGGEAGDEPWRRRARWQGERAPLVPMGMTGTPTDIGHCVAWMCSDYARLVTGCDFVVDGGARARNFAHIPAAPEDLMGPAPVIELDDTR